MEIFGLDCLFAETLLLLLPFTVSTIELSVSGYPCTKTDDCTLMISGNVRCDTLHSHCVCSEGFTELHKKLKCVAIASLGDVCESSEQCRKSDANSVCTFFDALHLHLMVCQCRAGYEDEEVDRRKKCVAVRRSSFLGGSPHFDSGDTVPIAMGCLAAGLALIACCAGIVQLMRKKNGNRSFRWSDSQHPHEALSLNGFNLSASSQVCGDPYAAICLTGVGHISNSSSIIMPSQAPPPPLPEEDLPPSYEEAIKQCMPVILVPVTQPDKV